MYTNQIVVVLTLFCKYNCPFCYAKKALNGTTWYDVSLLKYITKKAKLVQILGGEPLHDAVIVKFLNQAEDLSNVMVSTRYINHECIPKWLQKGLKMQFHVSELQPNEWLHSILTRFPRSTILKYTLSDSNYENLSNWTCLLKRLHISIAFETFDKKSLRTLCDYLKKIPIRLYTARICGYPWREQRFTITPMDTYPYLRSHSTCHRFLLQEDIAQLYLRQKQYYTQWYDKFSKFIIAHKQRKIPLSVLCSINLIQTPHLVYYFLEHWFNSK